MIPWRTVVLPLASLFLCACAATLPAKPLLVHRQLINTSAPDVASLIVRDYPITVDCDVRTNTILLKGPAKAVSAAGVAIDKLDQIPVDDGPTSVFFVRKLKNASAADVAILIQQLKPEDYPLPDSMKSPDIRPFVNIVVDPKTNSLLITADVNCEQQTRALIDNLDQPRIP